MQPQDYYDPQQPIYSSPSYRSPKQYGQKFLITVAVLVGLAIVLLAVAQNISKNKHAISANRFIVQRQVINKHASWLPEFTGISLLTDRGLSGDQATGLKYEFGLYSRQLPAASHRVVVDENNIHTPPIDRNNPSVNRSMTCNVKIDDTNYKATIGFSILSSEVSLTLSDMSGSTVYSSGPIDINTQTPID